MLIKMIKITLSLILALGLGASVSASPAWAAGSQKQQCDRAIWDCVKKAKRMTCSRDQFYARIVLDNKEYANQMLCDGPHKWWAAPGGTLARQCPSKGQIVNAASVDAAINRAHSDMAHNCVKYHVFRVPDAGPNHPINQYSDAKMNRGNCKAFADAFAQCLRAKAKKLPGGLKPHK
ncbi:MAG: hypothetical protein KQH53_02270 [Desulfarculaceae bacterium]|nr:hypothetical protein [Desulfarculaceae bacterium]